MQCEVTPPPFAITLRAEYLAVRDSLVELAGFALRRGYGAAFSADFQIIMGEVLNNIVEHAYAGESGDIVVTLTPHAKGIAVHLSDWGRPMASGILPAGHMPQVYPAEVFDQPEGGFGWAIIRSMARDLVYRHEVGCNILTFSVPIMVE